MNIPKCPSKMPRLLGMLLIIAAPIIFVLGAGANKKAQNNALNSDHVNIPLSQPTEISTQSGSLVFIYADYLTLSRNDAVCSVTDVDGNKIALTALKNERNVPLTGKKFLEFGAIASFMPTTDKVIVSCSNSGNSGGEYFVGSEVSASSFSPLLLLSLALTIIVLTLGCYIAINNVLARQRWMRKYA